MQERSWFSLLVWLPLLASCFTVNQFACAFLSLCCLVFWLGCNCSCLGFIKSKEKNSLIADAVLEHVFLEGGRFFDCNFFYPFLFFWRSGCAVLGSMIENSQINKYLLLFYWSWHVIQLSSLSLHTSKQWQVGKLKKQ